jgi:hypothetical protein
MRQIYLLSKSLTSLPGDRPRSKRLRSVAIFRFDKTSRRQPRWTILRLCRQEECLSSARRYARLLARQSADSTESSAAISCCVAIFTHVSSWPFPGLGKTAAFKPVVDSKLFRDPTLNVCYDCIYNFPLSKIVKQLYQAVCRGFDSHRPLHLASVHFRLSQRCALGDHSLDFRHGLPQPPVDCPRERVPRECARCLLQPRVATKAKGVIGKSGNLRVENAVSLRQSRVL